MTAKRLHPAKCGDYRAVCSSVSSWGQNKLSRMAAALAWQGSMCSASLHCRQHSDS